MNEELNREHAVEWYFVLGGTQQGPISFEVLKQMVNLKQLNPESLVWRRGMKEWVKALQVSELNELWYVQLHIPARVGHQIRRGASIKSGGARALNLISASVFVRRREVVVVL